MSQLVESLLTLARSDAGRLELDFRQIALSAVVADGIDFVEPLANSRNVKIVRDLAACKARVDVQRVTQVVTNLLSNALQASSAGREIRVTLTAESGHALLKVEDHGCGIPVDCQPHLFERFYRVGQARTRTSGGNGLGLAITKSIVDSHGGSITFQSTEGQETTFEVRLPLS